MRLLLILLFTCTAHAAELPHHIWLEAESFGPLYGYNFDITAAEKQPRGAWSVAGPGVASAWTQGGESEWTSIAARADEPAGTVVSREIEVPADATYTLWVRYADYRAKEERFGIRLVQGAGNTEHVFGVASVVDELDPMKLLWDWSFAWQRAEVKLAAGPARVELFTKGPTGARRQVDAICLTTNPQYRPAGREKPDFAVWKIMREIQRAGLPRVEPFAANRSFEIPKAWRLTPRPPAFLWNAGKQWSEELKKPAGQRVEEPFTVDEPLLNDFLAAHKSEPPLIYKEALSGPVWHIPEYPNAFASGSPALEWLEKHPDRPFGILLNYGTPRWPKDADRPAVYANLQKHRERLYGYISGESISHTAYDTAALEAKVRAAKSRAEVLAALREVHTASVVKKFSEMYEREVTAEEAWAPVIPCLSANMEAFAHALCDWGVARVGHENTANSPTLARRLAFLRGAARQFGRQFVDYQSANFGDSATMYSRQHFFYPPSSRYVLDNSYHAFGGAGMNWLWKDYVLWHLAGVSAFYNEQGIDLFWKPGGNSAGDHAPVQLSPKGKVAEAALRLARDHPRGTQYTPIAILLDEAHGWSQERFQPGAFGLDPSWNPAVLMPGLHEAAIRGWFDLAYYPAPETQNEPATAVRQGNVNAIFGDIFDAIVNTPGRTAALASYPVVIDAGESTPTDEWSHALLNYIEKGGTRVTCSPGLRGSTRADGDDRLRTANSFVWAAGGETIATQTFRYYPVNPLPGARVLATAPNGDVIATLLEIAKGRLIHIAVPLGLGLDERPVPILAKVLQHVAQDITPVCVIGDVEWTLNRLDDGSWLVALLNNSGVEKPQHGILPTRHEEARRVRVEAKFPVRESDEWIAKTPVQWSTNANGSEMEITVPAGAVRLVRIAR